MKMDDDPGQKEYFSSYEDLDVHKLMLEDEPRTTAYKKAILNNKAYFKDKVVMDVGCGTGILSIFCAQAGAKKVYAVEASSIAHLTREIVLQNNWDNVIEVIQDKVEDVILPNNTKVDAIVSEWMGFYLLHEGMLDSVLVARDKFLKDDGKMFPESAVIYVAPCCVPSLNRYWDDFEGIDMSVFSNELRVSKCNKPEITTIEENDLLGPEEALCWVNLIEDKVTDLDSYSLQHVVGSNKCDHYQGLCIWFECNFPDLSEGREEARIVLDTSPRSPPTHWKQTVIVLPEGISVDEGEPIAFKLEMKRSEENPRRYNLQMEMLDYENVEHPVPCSCYMTKCILVKELMTSHAQHAMEKDKDEHEDTSIADAQDIDVLEDQPIDDDFVSMKVK